LVARLAQRETQVNVLVIGWMVVDVEPTHLLPRTAGQEQRAGGDVIYLAHEVPFQRVSREVAAHWHGRSVRPDNRPGFLNASVGKQHQTPDRGCLWVRVGR